jgi:hypothetical protein
VKVNDVDWFGVPRNATNAASHGFDNPTFIQQSLNGDGGLTATVIATGNYLSGTAYYPNFFNLTMNY